ncbi:MAG: hypothetical protein RIT39_1460, partial [Bacteroidota bacterium]
MKNIKTGILGFYRGIMGCLFALVTGLLILNPDGTRAQAPQRPQAPQIAQNQEDEAKLIRQVFDS